MTRTWRESIVPHEQRHDRPCELKFLEQVANVCQNFSRQDACSAATRSARRNSNGLKDGVMARPRLYVHRRKIW
ncbi:hypothetical protein [Candidatus Accumulibacter sp. ACC012]|uniref:hypothetical protein n=1 Tax=Candidatus Accumulibacter sp. ACC012 TaxID=2823332 RepID=UPI0025BB64EE|nr:hypothetical protein [Candidatus Accumulibacter sp. ACC012]